MAPGQGPIVEPPLPRKTRIDGCGARKLGSWFNGSGGLFVSVPGGDYMAPAKPAHCRVRMDRAFCGLPNQPPAINKAALQTRHYRILVGGQCWVTAARLRVEPRAAGCHLNANLLTKQHGIWRVVPKVTSLQPGLVMYYTSIRPFVVVPA